MPTTLDEIMRVALNLAPGSRAMLVEQLMRSLDAQGQAEVDEAWAVVAEERIQGMQDGSVELIPSKQVFQELRNRGR
jgi:putative addiction module component (TIGR02574 family)